jgi:tRNA U55 pseudouridine synthase TruB
VLRRTAVGEFRVEDAHPLDHLLALAADVSLPLIPVRQALAGLHGFVASTADIARLRLGQQQALRHLPRPDRAGEVALVLDVSGDVAGLIEATASADGWRLVRLLGQG